MRFLAIDPGEKRIGLAVGDDTTCIASPVGMVEGGDIDVLVSAIQEHEPDELVVGLPLNMDGTDSPGATAARALADQLTVKLDIKVHLVDERLTSFQADEQMKQSGLTHKGKKERRDTLAAAAILRDFLESSPGTP